MSNEIVPKNESPAPLNAVAAIEQSRAIEQVQASLVIAKKFPRDVVAANSRIIEACKRLMLAEKAMYSYPRAGQTVTGPSIRLAEVLAQNYGNLNFGVRELERRNGASIAESFCWDLETNVMQSKTFEVSHQMQLKNGSTKKLTDPRDIYEHIANNGARRMRACILSIIPVDITEAAVRQCRLTIKAGDGKPIEDRIRDMVLRFKEMGVAQEMLEERLKHKIALTTPDEIVDLTAIYTALRDKQAKRADFFKGFEAEQSKTQTATVIDKINGVKPEESSEEVIDTDPTSFENFS